MPEETGIVQVCETYVRYIGQINESSAMRIKDLCETYPADKIMDAFKTAGRRGIKSWRYIEVILEKEVHKADPEKYTQGTYSRNVHSKGSDILSTWNKRRQRLIP